MHLLLASLTVAAVPETPDAVWTARGEHEYLGTALAVGDFDGDGFDDLAAGAPWGDGIDAGGGYIQVFFGGPTGLSDHGARVLVGQGGLGWSVAALDANGDGAHDLAATCEVSGETWVYLGSPLGPGPEPNLRLPAPGVAHALTASAGDVNGDGLDDLAILSESSAGWTLPSPLHIHHGSSCGIRPLADTAMVTHPLAGLLPGVGDIDGDGYGDLAVAAPLSASTPDGYAMGRISLFAGSPAGLAAETWTLWGRSDYDRLGSTLVGGDLDGDGYSDLLAGAAPNLQTPSWVEIFQGSPSGPIREDQVVFGTSWIFGQDLALLEDVDGDGLVDVAVSEGSDVFIARGLDLAVSQTLYDPMGGATVSGLASGDFDGDGMGDLVLARSSFPPGGLVQVHHARMVGVDADGDGHPAEVDCDDSDPAVHPGAVELCDPLDVDEDCDGLIDEDDPDAAPSSWSDFYIDADGDRQGSPSTSVQACDPPAGYAAGTQDCDDADPFRFAGAPEICGNGIDEDCDGSDLACEVGDPCAPEVPPQPDGPEWVVPGGDRDAEHPDRAAPVGSKGCGCSTAPGPGVAWLALPLLALARRRPAG